MIILGDGKADEWWAEEAGDAEAVYGPAPRDGLLKLQVQLNRSHKIMNLRFESILLRPQ